MRRAWDGFARLDALVVVATVMVVFVALGLVTDPGEAVAVAIAVPMLAALIAHCFARPSHGWEVFMAASLPGFAGNAAQDWLGISGAWGLVLIPLSLSLARDVDRGEAVAPAAPPAPRAR